MKLYNCFDIYLKSHEKKFDVIFTLSLQNGFRSFFTSFYYILATPNIAINCSNPSTVNEGDYFACNCDGTGGNPRANVTWYNSSRPITKGEEKAILRFTNVGKDDNGTYRCEAKSHGKPNITHFYLNGKYNIGQHKAC